MERERVYWREREKEGERPIDRERESETDRLGKEIRQRVSDKEKEGSRHADR